jgi:hypothetical protein
MFNYTPSLYVKIPGNRQFIYRITSYIFHSSKTILCGNPRTTMNLHLNNKGATASPYLKPLFNLNSEYKCLPNLNLAFIPLFKILHNLTIFLEKSILCISLHYSFLHTVSYAACKSISIPHTTISLIPKSFPLFASL